MVAVSALVVACAAEESASETVDLGKLDVGGIPTAPRQVHNQPSPPEATFLEGIRMADAVADASQFDSLLLYGWRADPIPDTASLVPLLGDAGKQVLDQNGWLAGYRAAYADRPQLAGGVHRRHMSGSRSRYCDFPMMQLRAPPRLHSR